jgi:hypothetical protein|tara:strand:- start:1240 stop:1362 length:123 start_codon:yes stop_codon:yes gene_type:complete
VKAKHMLILTKMLSTIISELDDMKAILKEAVMDESYGDEE